MRELMDLLAGQGGVWCLFIAIGAIGHWAKKAYNKDVSWNLAAYLFKERKERSTVTGVALLGLMWAGLSTDMLAGMTMVQIISMAAPQGWLIDSALNRGALPSGAIGVSSRARQGGFARPAFLAVIALVALAVSACAGMAVPQTKNQAAALSYYSIGQAYAQVQGMHARAEIDDDKAAGLILKLDMATAVLDLSRDPADAEANVRLTKVVAAMDRRGELDQRDAARARQALQLSGAAIAGDGLPDKDDVAGWLLLGSDMLRLVNSTTGG